MLSDEGAPGTITIDVPIAQVSLPNTAPLDDTLYSVTASTMTQAASETSPFGLLRRHRRRPVQPRRRRARLQRELRDADLSVTLADSPDPVKKDKPLTYTITVRNGGPAPATGVTLTDPLPAGVGLKSVKTTQGTCSSAKVGSTS